VEWIKLLEVHKSQGRPMIIPEWAIAALKQELLDPGFKVMERYKLGCKQRLKLTIM